MAANQRVQRNCISRCQRHQRFRESCPMYGGQLKILGDSLTPIDCLKICHSRWDEYDFSGPTDKSNCWESGQISGKSFWMVTSELNASNGVAKVWERSSEGLRYNYGFSQPSTIAKLLGKGFGHTWPANPYHGLKEIAPFDNEPWGERESQLRNRTSAFARACQTMARQTLRSALKTPCSQPGFRMDQF